MSWFGSWFRRRGVLGRSDEPTTVDIHHRSLRCQICGHGLFWRHDVQLHTPWASFFDVEWINRVATCAICAECGYIHWFLPPRVETESESA
jgi:hypothetical protein